MQRCSFSTKYKVFGFAAFCLIAFYDENLLDLNQTLKQIDNFIPKHSCWLLLDEINT